MTNSADPDQLASSLFAKGSAGQGLSVKTKVSMPLPSVHWYIKLCSFCKLIEKALIRLHRNVGLSGLSLFIKDSKTSFVMTCLFTCDRNPSLCIGLVHIL